MEEKGKKTKAKWTLLAALLCILAAVLAVVFLPRGSEESNVPVLTVETPQKIDLANTQQVMLDVTVSHFGEALYPAASMSIGFDSSRLEFLGVEEGNVFIHADANDAGVAQKLPQWSCNVENSNASGKINIMYLDMTGGKYAFSRELLAEDYNVVLRLKFRLRGSVRPGDVLELVVEDAIFAASDASSSLAMTEDTLKAKNGRLVIGG